MKYQNQCYMTNLETDIFNYKTPEFYINMKNIPDKTSQERKSFVLEEKKKCREGININGIRIPGSLYFHLNYYHLQGDDEKTGRKAVFLPRLRDNEWIFFNDYEEAFKKREIYTYFGLRQAGKSENIVSLCLRELSLFKETEAIALFSRNPDKDTFVKKITTAIQHGEKFIIIPNIDKDWGKEEIRFGFTKQDNSIELRGRLFIYNTQEGKKIQISAGKTPSFFLMDEIAISPFRAVYDALEPGLLTDYGQLRCSPLFTFTGGEVEKAKDAESLVKHPTEKQFKTIIEEDKIIGGRFMSGLYRKDCKEETTLSKYLNKKTNTWIDDYPIYISNFKKAEETIEREKKEAVKSPDKSTFLMKRIFFPLSLDDVFLSESNNNFPVDAIRPHLDFLKKNYELNTVELYRDNNNNVKHKSTSKYIVTDFPARAETNKDAAVVIYEEPLENVPDYTYIAGIDCINENETSDKINSLAVIYIYKRMHDPTKPFQNSIVASYAGRPKTVKEFNQICLDLMEYYNAIALPEAENKAFLEWFYHKKKEHLLVDGLPIAKEINPRTLTKNEKGLKATTPNQRFYMNLMVEYTKDLIDSGENGELMGLHRIPDYMLLEEMVNYRSKESTSKGVHDGNFDRIVTFGHCLILASIMDRDASLVNLPVLEVKSNGFNLSKRMNSFIRPNIKRSPFSGEKIGKSKNQPFNPFI